MMERQAGDQSQLFSLFNREERIPARHLLRRINPIVTRVLADLREKLKPFHRETGRPSIDPELMLKTLIVGCCHGLRFERKLGEEVELPLADARDHARSLKGTLEFEQSWNERKKVEMRFAHLKVSHRFERMRLRGLTGARDEFHLAAIMQISRHSQATSGCRRRTSKLLRVSHKRAAAKPSKLPNGALPYPFRAPRRAPEGNRP
jgi:transposase